MSKLNGCHNRPPFLALISVQVGWDYIPVSYVYEHRAAVIRRIPNLMSKDCQYSLLTRNDPGCEGCKWKRQDFPEENVLSSGTENPAATAGIIPPRPERTPG